MSDIDLAVSDWSFGRLQKLARERANAGGVEFLDWGSGFRLSYPSGVVIEVRDDPGRKARVMRRSLVGNWAKLWPDVFVMGYLETGEQS